MIMNRRRNQADMRFILTRIRPIFKAAHPPAPFQLPHYQFFYRIYENIAPILNIPALD